MIANVFRKRCWSLLGGTAAAVAALAMFGVVESARAQFFGGDRGYVGYSYLEVPGVRGDWSAAPYRGFVRVDGHYWRSAASPGRRAGAAGSGNSVAQQPSEGRASQGGAQAQGGSRGQGQAQAQGQGGGLLRRAAVASIPGAPRTGEGTLVLALRTDSPALPTLIERCRGGAVMPEVRYSVDAERSRRYSEKGPMPAGMPQYFDYILRDVRFVDCPVVDGAPEQAIVVQFNDIEWLNWSSEAASVPVVLEPARLDPLPRNLTGETRAWVLSWFAMAHDVSDDQCPVMHERPGEDDYYALMSPEEAERERAALADQGGPNYQNGQMGLRGPNRLNVTFLPGIVPDPGLAEPQTRIARGLNVDGRNRGRHRNYVSEDGAVSGIDNQLYTVMGCIAGWQGHNGFILQFANNQMRDGEMSILLEISGIDNDRNDPEVYVTILYSMDDMAKNSAGTQILPNFTFHVTDQPAFTHYFARLRGRIVDGVVTTAPVDQLQFNLGNFGMPPELTLTDAAMRIELRDDGTIAGVVGGYRDWLDISTTYQSSAAEFYHGFQQPALYNALRRSADGIRHPVTGEYHGISTAYDMEGVRAFIVHEPPAVAQINQGASGGS